MPQITKVRIANFQYNNGRRLIADELFDFENEREKPSDVLINLVNGGGKSVLVQLMMQPVIPRAKVAGRRIESFFTRPSDHCYVVLEWALDDSRVRLMTGIAMAASDSAGDPDADRGFQIKYYTFLSSYQSYEGEANILGLPLSRREKGRFIPAQYDDIRSMAKKSGGKLTRYSSDDSVSWRERLAQYGIVQNEWRMIEDLNSNEDGLSKYFAGLRTSDALIDTLILPRIEEKQRSAGSRDDSSLETMLLSYARKYAGQEAVIREREICGGFRDMLETAGGEAEQLWKSSDALSGCIAGLFAYADALEEAIKAGKAALEGLEREKDSLGEGIRHIRWEKISAELYACRRTLEKEEENLSRAEQERERAGEQQREAEKRLRLLECAHYYGQLTAVESRLEAVAEEIRSRETNAESRQTLQRLKYSAACAIRQEMARIEPERQALDGERKAAREAADELDRELSKLRAGLTAARERAAGTEAVLERQRRDNDGIVEELGIGAFRMLDGRFQESELHEWEAAEKAALQNMQSETAAQEKKIRALEERRERLPMEMAEKKSLIRQRERELESLAGQIAEYTEAEEGIRRICERYSLDFEQRFAGSIPGYLREQLALTGGRIRDALREIESAEEASSAVKRGTLHIPKLITDFLDSAGVRYTTFESYLLHQRQEQLVSGEEAARLLESYPYAAYAVITDRAGYAALLEETEGRWLPSVLPVLTPEDVERMLQQEQSGFAAVAAYAGDYFRDPQEYAAQRDRLLEELKKKLSLQQGREESLRRDLACAEAFSVYEENWLDARLHERTETGKRIEEENQALEKLERELDEKKKSIEESREAIRRLSLEAGRAENRLASYRKLLERLREEELLQDSLDREYGEIRQTERAEKETDARKILLEQKCRDAEQRLGELRSIADSLESGLAQVEEAEETELVEGRWRDLLDRYRTLLDAQSADLKRLGEDRNRLLLEKEEKRKELDKRDCLQEEYEELLYSEEREAEAVRTVRIAEGACREAERIYSRCYREQGIAASACRSAGDRLAEFGGEPLPENQVGQAFDERMADIRKKLQDVTAESRRKADALSGLEKAQGRAESAMESYARPLQYSPAVLEEDYASQLSSLTGKIREWKRAVSAGERQIADSLRKMAERYGSASPDIGMAVASMRELLTSDAVRGDRYFTLCEHIQANRHTAQLRIAQIDTDLREFHRTKGDLIHQCMIQGKQMFEGLMQLSGNSKVRVQNRRRQMLRFDISETVDENAAKAAIEAEIDKGTQELVEKMAGEHTESEIRRIAVRTVGSRRLLRKYIGSENIVLKAYKIDRNPDNSGYRTWEQTQINNSGAEKFVVYFAVILALMVYARDSYDEMGSAGNRSVLILDNPFGPISSKHMLEPMFEIARNYNVQMICLSDISKSDIVSCFDQVIRVVVRQFALSTKEQLTHEGNESIEHGFYKQEQMDLFG